MPLRLKSLELHGYKTFATKFDFEFAEGITAIVGPNGSGKSNIADALRWVLGEQSYSLLRAKKTEDMIFAGSEQRPRSGMASATVTFDNSSGWLPVDFSEVGLSRRAYRDGRNEYLLNSQHVRLKDINELLAQSGLSERTYTILGQGLVDASLALKADERRRLFEEAAGIGLYRSRREEALRRIETTERNLDRAMDILAEIEPRLRSLERQAAKAQEFALVQADLKQLLRDWYGYHWHRTQLDLSKSVEAARAQETRLEAEREAYQKVRQEFAAFRDQLNSLRARLNSWHRHSAQLHANRESNSSEAAALEERQRSLLDNRQRISSEIAGIEDEERISVEQLVEITGETKAKQSEVSNVKNQLEASQKAMIEARSVITKLETELTGLRGKLEQFQIRRSGLQAHLDELNNRSEQQAQKIVESEQSIVRASSELDKVGTKNAELASSSSQAEKELQAVLAEQTSAEKQISQLKEQLNQKQGSLGQLHAQGAALQAQLSVLEQADQSLAGFADGSKVLLEAARRQDLNGSIGALSNRIEVEGELEAAIAAALGEYTDAILLQNGSATEQAFQVLAGAKSSRASILPLDWLKPSEVLSMHPEGDVIGTASELVKAPIELRPVVDLLLGQVIVVRNRKTARAILANYEGNVRAVTLEGEVFHASGPILAGKPTQTAALGRTRQKREILDAISKTGTKIQDLVKELEKLNTTLSTEKNAFSLIETKVREKTNLHTLAVKNEQEFRLEAEAAQKQLDWQKNLINTLEAEKAIAEKEREETQKNLTDITPVISATEGEIRLKAGAISKDTLEELQNQVAQLSTQAAVTEKELANSLRRETERQEVVNQLNERKFLLAQRMRDLELSLQNVEKEREDIKQKVITFNAELEELRTFIGPAEKELTLAEQQENDLQKREIEGQAALSRVERLHNQLQLELNRKQEAIGALRGRIEDDFGLVMFEYADEVSGPVPLPFEGLVEQLPVIEEIKPDLEETLAHQRAQLRRMGAVNPEAKQEFLAVKERHTFLTSQIEDLRKAENDLQTVIAELDDLTRKEFLKTFEAVAEVFHTIFHRLFGGGAARLVLTDPENVTETGIDIEARLPGRREQGLSLLSGGERSLTAIALVFALLKVSPTPVCVLDEVDAMLDEANVSRFRDLLAELSKDTQFVIITHNRNTVQAAAMIYGVTMGRDSTSQVISLKLDEVSEDYYK